MSNLNRKNIMYKRRQPTIGEIFEKYARPSNGKHRCCGCGQKNKRELIYFAKPGSNLIHDKESIYCYSCFIQLTKADREYLFIKYNQLPINRKRCTWCGIISHNIIKFGSFGNKKVLCHNCWGYNKTITKRRR